MDVNKICRMCLISKDSLKSIFEVSAQENLVAIISKLLQLSISTNDGLPPNICNCCVNILTDMRANVEEFRENDRKLRHLISVSIESKCKADEVILPEINVESPLREGLNSNDSRVAIPNAIVQEVFDKNEKRIYGNEEERQSATSSNENSETETYSEYASKLIVQLPKNKRTATVITPRNKKKQNISNRNRPKLNDYKCYICGNSESMGSAKALLEHLTIHLDLMPQTCTDCVMETVVLKNVRSLNVHKKMHAQPIKCQYCDRRYSDYYARDGHIKSYHLGESAPCPSTCEQCGKVCKSVAALKSHMRDHKLDVKCDYCAKVFHRMSKLREHVRRVHEKADKYDCSICNQVLHSLESYNSHLKMHNAEKTYICDLCPMKFYTAGNLGLHKKVHAKNSNYKPHKDWTNHYSISHDVTRGKVYTCKHCGNEYCGTINTIISHVKHHFKDIKCDQCDLKFTNMHKLKIHYVVHTRERNYRCEHCGKDFMYRTHMNYHIKHKHRSHEHAGSNVSFNTTVEEQAKGADDS